MHNIDIEIRGGLIVDGTRGPAFRGNIYISDGQIVQIGGDSPGPAQSVIDAEGMVVAPGFIDLHTHYDAQIRWDPWCTASGWHGVTLTALGNCGFGFAPCKPDFRQRSVNTMTRTEAIPLNSMIEGLLPHWDWETIPEYLDSLDRAPKGVNVIQYLPTGSLMTYVMGLDAARSREATETERAEMRRLLNEGMDAGLCGFSLQRLGPESVQRDVDGSPMVTDTMSDDEIFNLAQVLRDRNEGLIQIAQGTGSDEDLAFEERLAAFAQRPILHNAVLAGKKASLHRRVVDWIERCQGSGLPVYGQCAHLRSAFAVTLNDWNLYDALPAWREATVGTKEQKRAKFMDPTVRAQIILETDEGNTAFKYMEALSGGPIRNFVVQGVNRQQDLQQYVGKSLGQIAAEEGKHPIEAMFDLSLAGDLNVEFLAPEKQEWHGENTADMLLSSEYTLPGVSDGGAHTKFFCGGSYTTDFLCWLVRDEKRVTLEEAHYRLSALPAQMVGLKNRGVLSPGSAADVVVYDLDALAVDPPFVGSVANDLPGGEWRRIQRAKGYRSIIVNGVETFANGECTGATPGRLLRGAND